MRRLVVRITLSIFVLVMIGVVLLLLRNYQMNEATLKFKEDNGIAAVGKLKPLAYLGDKTAQFLLGNAYAFGWSGVQKNDAEAIYWFRRCSSFGPLAIEEGVDPAAPYELGVGKTYASGAEGVKADPAESLKWLKLADKGGSKEAAAMLTQSQH
jgi:TPR repeat protein